MVGTPNQQINKSNRISNFDFLDADTNMAHGRFDNPIVAALAGVKDFFRKQDLADKLKDSDRIDGKTCLVTGANSGLGYALAVQLAQRGGQVILAQRRQIPESELKAREESNSKLVYSQHLDLSKIGSIHDFVDGLKKSGTKLDIIILNAGVALPASRKTDSGLEEMFLVNYLSNFILLNLMLKEGIIGSGKSIPRIVFISSDSHQGSSFIDFDEFGKYFDYGVSKGMNYYSYYKLVLNTFAVELSRRLNNSGLKFCVNVICPGPVNTNIIKEAPLLLRVALGGIFSIIFKKPADAAKAVIYMSISSDYEGKTGEYLHMFNIKQMDDKVYLPEEGKKLWEASASIWKLVDKGAKLFSE
jgi:NAD(P)-dependent dehydrogenase (short-subunit alcohol dehydrogenase family)